MIKAQNDVRFGGQAEVLRKSCPDVVPLSQVMTTLRNCGKDIGLTAQVLRSLEVMLSCLAPKRNHHIVFASNATLSQRCGGLSDRSLRRHINQLISLGFVTRADSPNGKRYSCHDPLECVTLRFGLDFAPLFEQMPLLMQKAQVCVEQALQKQFLRRKLRAACYLLLQSEPDNSFALAAMKAVRRNLSNIELKSLLEHLPQITCPLDLKSTNMADTDGQNDRHQSNLSTEQLDKSTEPKIDQLIQNCPEAQSFIPKPIKNGDDVIACADILAPMIGVKQTILQRAKILHGDIHVSALIWLIVQRMKHIANPMAYFYSVTLGAKSQDFDPWAWLDRLSNGDCPRTI